MEKNIDIPIRENILVPFGSNLKLLRVKKHLTQEDISYMAGFSRSYYAEVEQGKRNISLVNLFKLAVALETTVSNLTDFEYGTKNK